MPGQTIEDVCRAEAVFVEEVAKRHPEAEGKPIVIANCQAGWQIMMMAAIRPDLAGPIMLAGTPLSYWAGVRGKNPMRYLGGTARRHVADRARRRHGRGIFDGANLVANFESLNPANTYWTKPYNVYSKVDTGDRALPRIRDLVGQPGAAERRRDAVDRRQPVRRQQARRPARSAPPTACASICATSSRRSSCFCSWGDDITPPQQALDWILDLYDDASEIVANGQTIIYSLHHSIGHLGIFVSGKVAAKEHSEFVSCMEMIDAMPPGLYEAVISDVGEDTANRDLVDGKYLFRLEPRTLDDIRAFGVNSPEDDKRFATVARLSEINLGLYRTFAEPWVRASVTEPMAEAMRAMHPNRLRFELFSDRNPFMSAIKPLAEQVRANRKPVSADNPLLAIEKQCLVLDTSALENWGEMRDSHDRGVLSRRPTGRRSCRRWSVSARRAMRPRTASSAISCARPPPPKLRLGLDAEVRGRRRRGGGAARADLCAKARRRVRRAGLTGC